MSRAAVCGACNGTGSVIVYEVWEQVLRRNAAMVEYAAEEDTRRLISLDVEGSYPTALVVTGYDRYETDEEAVDETLGFWPRGGAKDLPTHPANVENGAFYRPVDPRFYEAKETS